MKKINKALNSPPALAQFAIADPMETWDNFAQTQQQGKKDCQDQLRADQRQICAYCEIDLNRASGVGLDDFRVEHFHPKRRPPPPPPNWDLDWNNLLAVCSGGNVCDVGLSQRYTRPDYSCDVPKGHKNLSGVILNPLEDIPAFPPLFEFAEDGSMHVGPLCPDALRDKCTHTIIELRLSAHSTHRPKSVRLSRMREAVIKELRSQSIILEADGATLEEAFTEMAEAMFSDDPSEPWPAFFSCIRWFLDAPAERRLIEIGYTG